MLSRKCLVVFLVMLAGVSIWPRSSFAQSAAKAEVLDVIIVMDNSLSNKTTDPMNLREHFTRALVHLFSVDADYTSVRLGVILFSSKAEFLRLDPSSQEAYPLLDPTTADTKNLEFPEPHGLTVIDAPLQLAYQAFVANGTYELGHASAVIFISDGRPEYDEKPGAQDEEVQELFRRARPWVEKMGQHGTKLYVLTYGSDVLRLSEWEEMAQLTGGRYESVESVREVTRLYVEIVANALLGYSPHHILEFTKMQPLQEVKRTFEVLPGTNRLIVFAMRIDPTTEIHLYYPSGEEVSDADQEVLVRGGGAGVYDKVWRIDNPAPGEWELTFYGGISYVEAWRFSRSYDIQMIAPVKDAIVEPGQPVRLIAVLADHLTGEVAALTPTEYSVEMFARWTEPLPAGVTSDPVAMAYNSSSKEFSTTFIPPKEGRYLLQFILNVEGTTLAKAEYTLQVGILPRLEAEIEVADTNGVAGIQPDEPAILLVRVANPEAVAPPADFNLAAHIEGEQQDLTIPSSDFERAAQGEYKVPLPELSPGNYTVSVWAYGKTKSGFAYDSSSLPPLYLSLQVSPYPEPTLLGVTIPPVTYWSEPLDVRTEVERYNLQQAPHVAIEVYDPQGHLFDGGQVPFQKAQGEKRLLYEWFSKPVRKLGAYKVRVHVLGGQETQSVEQEVRVVLKPAHQLGLGGLILIVAIALLVWIRWRRIQSYLVIGSLEIVAPVKDKVPLSAFESHIVTIGRGGMVDLREDPNIVDVVARIIGQAPVNHNQPPCIEAVREGVLVNGLDVYKEPDHQRVLLDGAEIEIGSYRMQYFLTVKRASANI